VDSWDVAIQARAATRRRGHPPAISSLIVVFLLRRRGCGLLPTAIPPQRASSALRRLKTPRNMIKSGGCGTKSCSILSELTRKWHVTYEPSFQASGVRTNAVSDCKLRISSFQNVQLGIADGRVLPVRLPVFRCYFNNNPSVPAVTSVNFGSKHRQWSLYLTSKTSIGRQLLAAPRLCQLAVFPECMGRGRKSPTGDPQDGQVATIAPVFDSVCTSPIYQASGRAHLVCQCTRCVRVITRAAKQVCLRQKESRTPKPNPQRVPPVRRNDAVAQRREDDVTPGEPIGSSDKVGNQ
jgi:hypothetical protein